MPSINPPTKSHETKTFLDRPVHPREPLPVKAQNTNFYENLEDLNKRVTKLKIGPWSYRICNDKTYIEVNEAPFLVPKYSIKIDESLNFIVTVYNWPLPDDHNVYINHRQSLRNMFISSLLSGIEDFVMCPGVKLNMESSRLHSIPIEIDENLVCPSTSKEIYRAGVTCYHCHCLRHAKNALK